MFRYISWAFDFVFWLRIGKFFCVFFFSVDVGVFIVVVDDVVC